MYIEIDRYNWNEISMTRKLRFDWLYRGFNYNIYIYISPNITDIANYYLDINKMRYIDDDLENKINLTQQVTNQIEREKERETKST